MKDLVDGAMARAMEFQADGGSGEFYRRLAEGRFQSTRCLCCGRTAFPPRPFCPGCGAGEVEWADLPRRGRLHAFTQQGRALRFLRPEVLGLVELEGVGLVLSRIDAPFEALSLGQELEVAFLPVGGGVVLHQFRPV
ncbi:MAG: OB-fold domain-containing protein [Planctomycetes bacterium]|nr:OB-fold domain-containing protein [Planctomycetota bacterium]